MQWIPLDRRLLLPAPLVECLVEVAFAKEQRYSHHRDPQIGAGFQGVSGEHTKPTRVGRHTLTDGDFHREISDSPCPIGVFLVRRKERLQVSLRLREKFVPTIFRTEIDRLTFVESGQPSLRQNRHSANRVFHHHAYKSVLSLRVSPALLALRHSGRSASARA